MSDNPERIWACMQGPMVGLFVSGGYTAGWPEYVRADLIEAQAAEIERLTKWEPIETAPDDDWFLAAIEVRHKSGGRWWEYHVIWLDDETNDVHTDCEQGWSISDYSHWVALPNAPYPLNAGENALENKP